MKFEERATVLCAQALTANDETEVRKILAELRLVLHQHIEQLRGGLLVVYTESMIRLKSSEQTQRGHEARIGIMEPENESLAGDRDARKDVPRSWQQLVHEIACEQDHDKALQLSQTLGRLLQP